MVGINDWSVKPEIKDEHTCIHVVISTKLDFTKLDFTLLDENRIPIVIMRVTNCEIYFCVPSIGRPMFAQLGDSVKYITGSGAEAYKNK